MVEDSLSKFTGKRPSFLDLPSSKMESGYSSGRLVSSRVRGVAGVGVSVVSEVERPHVKGDGFWSRYQLNSKILDSKTARKYMLFSVRDDLFKYLFVQAGRGEVTVPEGSYACGSYRRLNVCDNLEGHKGKIVGGSDVEGKYVVGVEVVSCNRIGCPMCFLSHAVNVARSASARLETASEKGFGVVEHGTIAPAVELVAEFMEKFGKSWEGKLWAYCWEQLKSFGVLGCAMVRHARRADRKRQDLYASLHYHFVGFLAGGFDVCRACESRDKWTGVSPECRSCGGFMGRVVRGNDGGNRCIVKVFESRKTVVGTFCYVMSHCSQRVDVKRDHVLRYFGVVANCRLKSKPVDKRVRCAVCGEEVRRDLRYVGSRKIVRNVWEPLFRSFVCVEPKDSVTGLDNFVDEASFVDEGGGLNG